MAMTAQELRGLDAQYKPFPTFERWAAAPIALEAWDRTRSELDAQRARSNALVLAAAARSVLRAAAADTGAIEGLYPPDRGFTITVLTEAAAWDSALQTKPGNVRELLEAQLKGYELAFDAATTQTRLSEAWIRRLHEVLCAAQNTYQVYVEIGGELKQTSKTLRKGEYKADPNHVRLPDGAFHAYAPVLATAAEMHRLVDELSTDAFARAHPVLQASYAHYALACVHPFADGNGRVARVLASVFLLRAVSVPLVVFYEQKDEYLDALAAADGDRYQAFVRFVADRSRDAMRIVTLQLRPAPESALEQLASLLVSSSGMSHEQLSAIAIQLIDRVATEVNGQLSRMSFPSGVSYASSIQQEGLSFGVPGYVEARAADGSAKTLYVSLRSASPSGGAGTWFGAFAGRVDQDEPILLACGSARETLSVRLNEIQPTETPAFRAALAAWVRAMLGQLATRLRQRVAATLEQPG